MFVIKVSDSRGSEDEAAEQYFLLRDEGGMRRRSNPEEASKYSYKAEAQSVIDGIAWGQLLQAEVIEI